ncbi:hypothetical protein QFZ77_002551 [Paenibacillus sp. V4I3]|uniref:hypothetical protein n=1 Tax=unclassified Paenibacillus TaxID=185978 RepID=UPI00278A143D|nr:MULTISPECIES: hypothetical protein [unclassified Paenibacillus]MDQ0873892.1 hypothetical protein [Paenibacillus sp. V4I3]MDQ0890229.1 hypothetical protein [Paenibacillus sp. V4I9]
MTPRIEKMTSHEKIAPFTNFVQTLLSEEEVKEVVQAIGYHDKGKKSPMAHINELSPSRSPNGCSNSGKFPNPLVPPACKVMSDDISFPPFI